MDTVNEGTSSRHPFTLLGDTGEPVIPEALAYRLMASSTTAVVDWSALPLDATAVEVSGANNTIGPTGAKRFLIIEASHSNGEMLTKQISYELVKIKGGPTPLPLT